VASHLRYNTSTTIDVKNPGGINKVTLRFMSNEVLEATLTGKALIVAVGNLTKEALIPDEDTLKDHWRNI
jgi:diaminopimelate epimerase